MVFHFTDDELNALKRKDKRLARLIEKIGRIEREGDEDIFSAVIHHIIAQQISTKAQASIWARVFVRFFARSMPSLCSKLVRRKSALL